MAATEAPTVTLGIRDRSEARLERITDGRIVDHRCALSTRSARDRRRSMTRRSAHAGPSCCSAIPSARHNAEAFDADGYFRTATSATVRTERLSHGSGREKDLIIRGGENLGPKEVEDALRPTSGRRGGRRRRHASREARRSGMRIRDTKPGCSVDVAALAAHLEAGGTGAGRSFPSGWSWSTTCRARPRARRRTCCEPGSRKRSQVGRRARPRRHRGSAPAVNERHASQDGTAG